MLRPSSASTHKAPAVGATYQPEASGKYNDHVSAAALMIKHGISSSSYLNPMNGSVGAHGSEKTRNS